MMNYVEFRKTYSWMLKHYPDTSALYGINNAGTITIEHQERATLGGRWKQSEGTTTDKIDGTYYCNAVDAIPFFRNLGGKEQITRAYTKYGYIPVKIVSTSPDGLQRTIRTFKF